jgi:hypothetical protein
MSQTEYGPERVGTRAAASGSRVFGKRGTTTISQRRGQAAGSPRRRQVEAIWALGAARVIFELIDKIARHEVVPKLDERLVEHYSVLEREMLPAPGGNKFPASPPHSGLAEGRVMPAHPGGSELRYGEADGTAAARGWPAEDPDVSP